MQVSIIIINYNTFQLTCNCIYSIIRYTTGVEYEIILVDNNSAECDADLFLQRFPSIILVKNTENIGFAKGNNAGIAYARGEYILLLNSDTYLTENSIAISLKSIQSDNKIGVLGVRMTYENGRVQNTARRFRGIQWELFDLLRFIPLLMPYAKRAKLMLGKYFKSDFNTECDWANGAYFLFPKKILSLFPGNKLDERFFMYGEDQLWCYQFKEVGYCNYFLSDTTIVHINNGSTKKEKQLKLILVMIKNELEIIRERKGRGLYYYLFCAVYLSKEYGRYTVKYLAYKFSGKLIR